jgi:hypothetical protein
MLTDAVGKTDAPIRFAGTVGGPADVISESMLAPWTCEHLNLPCDMIAVAGDTSADTELMLQRGEVNSNFTAIGAISRSRTVRSSTTTPVMSRSPRTPRPRSTIPRV